MSSKSRLSVLTIQGAYKMNARDGKQSKLTEEWIRWKMIDTLESLLWLVFLEGSGIAFKSFHKLENAVEREMSKQH